MTWILLISAAMAAISFAVMVGSLTVYIWTDSNTAYKLGLSAIIIGLTMALTLVLTIVMMNA